MTSPRIRFGGRQTARGFRFELSGGHPALDFANTLDERTGDPPRELLHGYGDLLRWALQSGVVTPAEGRALAGAARRDSGEAARVFARAIRLREAIFRIFHGWSCGAGPAAADVALLERTVRAAHRYRRIVRSGDRVRWTWGPLTPAAILWRVADAAASLLTSDRLADVRTCDGSDCLWLFVDSSRHRNRRWCDMTVCGNRAKARRHYAKTRGG